MQKQYNVLFLCTGNSARSIMAEAILNERAKGRFTAYSAGSQPTDRVNPAAINQLEMARLPVRDLRSKSWDEFGQPGAPHLDFVFSVCDNAAREACPIWPGQPMTAHWGIPNPAMVSGDKAQVARAFRDAFMALERRISLFISLPFESLDNLAIKREIDQIGKE